MTCPCGMHVLCRVGSVKSTVRCPSHSLPQCVQRMLLEKTCSALPRGAFDNLIIWSIQIGVWPNHMGKYDYNQPMWMVQFWSKYLWNYQMCKLIQF